MYRDLLLGDLDETPIRGRRRWEKRLSHEEVLISIPGISNEEKMPFLSTILKKKTPKEELEEGSSVILKEWRKMKQAPVLGAYPIDIPQGIRIVHRYLKSTSSLATCRDLILLQVSIEWNSQ